MTSLLILAEDAAQAGALSGSLARLQPELKILVSSGGAEAREYMSSGRVFDLVLTDVGLAELDGFEFAGWVAQHSPETSLFAMANRGDDPAATTLHALGAIECFTKPIDPELLLLRFREALSQSVSGHVQNLSLASFLQLLEMERKTCQLSVRCGDKHGKLTVRRGVLVHAESEDERGDPAAVSIVAWPNPGIIITRTNDADTATVQQSLGFIIMEAMRVQDEAARGVARSDGLGSHWPQERRTFRPSAGPLRYSQPPNTDLPSRLNGDSMLSSGARLLAVVDTVTGAVLQYTAANGSPVNELARNASLVLQQEMTTLKLCNVEGLEELVLSTTTRCDVIRPLGSNQFALLVFAPEETNLVMARLELEQFVASALSDQSFPRERLES